ncbi:A/G-specific adenine glycosylase [Pseudoruegeria sp. SHC-113]|uniref:A/G-specific adenine glycosylase n=1 Tax=Pseudoruegeria sp. SHC-113 TaxID=2855439 RepID=UPI0021BAE682|nr:A/G-specific adenine glycosylase [Pseudoruegeria sp. SHC-113]MCT8158496.1 A/G-specific adenine glycosylase [Pseudoruegeria sp. SHC-113]
MRETASAEGLLEWYDRHARDLPWRVPPAERKAGVAPDPYRVWLSEIMLQQTTVAAVRDYFARFTARWPTVEALAAGEDGEVMAEWAGLGYYARARNLLKCARAVVADHGGQFPADHAALLKLPGIGPYTAGAISAIAFDLPEVVVDGNVERVMSRLFRVETPLPTAKPELTALAKGMTPKARPGDYAQAVMDLGATICTPRSPACGICPWQGPCLARKGSVQAELPRKLPKKPKPTRYGAVFIGQRADGAVLVERRPEKGLLGGTLGWPGSAWEEAELPVHEAPAPGDWAELSGEVRHTFTHFHLILTVHAATLPMGTNPSQGYFLENSAFSPSDMPTVMRKAYELAQS